MSAIIHGYILAKVVSVATRLEATSVHVHQELGAKIQRTHLALQ